LLHSTRAEDNTAKFSCSCGVQIYSKIKARRKEEVFVYLPYGSSIVDFRAEARSYAAVIYPFPDSLAMYYERLPVG